MPELPEVETIKQDLEKKIAGRTVNRVDVHLLRMIRKHDSAEEFKQAVEGRSIKSMERRGKFLLFHLESENTMVLHLGMTGQLLLRSSQSPLKVDKHTHLVFHFNDSNMLLFRDVRQFGQVFLARTSALEKQLGLGPEPLSPDFREKDLVSVLNRTTKVKQLLMDQKRIAGIGNIYADEALFEAGIHPLRPANSLTPQETQRLFPALQRILREAIELRGTSIADYVDTSGRRGEMQNRHRVYRRTGGPCQRCGEKIRKIKMGGRSTHFCPQCQRLSLLPSSCSYSQSCELRLA